MDDSTTFKTCSLCEFTWSTRESFLSDPDINLLGYQVDFDDVAAGLFLFVHSCETSLAIPAGRFGDLYDGPMFAERLTGTEQCPGYCLRVDEMARCLAKCECAYVREILQIINGWPKRSRPQGR